MRFGAPDVLVADEAPDPEPGPGQALVEVAVADTLHLDTVMRRGAFPFPVVTPPYVPGGGVAGEVAAVGPGVERGLLGRRVVARTGAGEPAAQTETVARRAARDSHSGGYAQRAVVPASTLIPVPAGVDLRRAAALVNDGMTAVLLCEAAGIRPGDRVLVTPAAGGVGTLLVQAARAAGARVVGAARGERKLRLALDSGAEAAADYARADWAERVRDVTGGRGADVVLDGVGGAVGRTSLQLTAPAGTFLAYGAPGGEFTPLGDAAPGGMRALSLPELPMRPGDERRFTERALAETAAGRLDPLIGQTFPLERAAEAHAAIEARNVVGKSLLLT